MLLAEILIAQKRYSEAEALLLPALKLWGDRVGEEGPSFKETARLLSELYGRLGRPEKAAQYRRLLKRSN